jgi:oxygen-independent coproporphyrinogen-3 oxidase
MDHFAKRSDPLWHAYEGGNLHRNFMGYTPNHLKPQLGLGVSAIGDADTALMQNEKVLEKYYMRLEKGELPILRGHALNAEDLVLRRHILNLMTRFSTTWNDMQSHVAFLAGVPERLREFEVDGLVKLNQAGVSVLPAGRPFIRNIVMAFDARLARRAPDTALFSTSI